MLAFLRCMLSLCTPIVGISFHSSSPVDDLLLIMNHERLGVTTVRARTILIAPIYLGVNPFLSIFCE